MEIIGHQEIIGYLTKALDKGSLGHAYLFSGPEHVGKNTVAKWLVEKLLNKDEEFWDKPNPDLHIIEKAEDKREISIDQVRELRAKMSQKPLLESHKIVMIENIEEMSIAAVNALLKTLEEPPGDSLIILTTSKIDKVLPTIVSRCQLVKFKRIPGEELTQELKTRKIKNAEELSSLSAGRPGLALAWAEDAEMLNEVTTSANKFTSLIMSGLDQRMQFVEALLPKGLTLADQVNVVLSNLTNWEAALRDTLLIRSGISDNITNVHAMSELKKIAKKCSNLQLIEWQKQIDETRGFLKQNVNPRLVLENLLLKFELNA